MVTSELLYVGLVGLVGAERVAELVVSRRNAARCLARGAVEHGRGHFPAMAAFHLAFLVACVVEVVAAHRPVPPIVGPLALAAVGAAQALRWWAIATLGDRWNVRILVEPGAELVVGGPYRFVRHPNYVAVVIEVACLPLVHGAWVTAIVGTILNACLLVVRIRAEERALGSRWEAAFEGRRRFVPAVRRAQRAEG